MPDDRDSVVDRYKYRRFLNNTGGTEYGACAFFSILRAYSLLRLFTMLSARNPFFFVSLLLRRSRTYNTKRLASVELELVVEGAAAFILTRWVFCAGADSKASKLGIK